MSTGNPWFKFRADLWRSDQGLRLCSLAARGIWIEILCLMHEAEPRGHLMINGKIPSQQQVATLIGAPLDAVADALKELEDNNVFSRTGAGAVYSRRMVADTKREQIWKKHGKKGGVKAQENKRNSSQVKPTLDHKNLEYRTQKLEGREEGVTDRTELNQSNTESSPARKYEFQGRVIKLNARDLEAWRTAFPAIIDLRAELTGIDAYLSGLDPDKRKRWFHSVPGMLARKHQEALAKAPKPPAPRDHTPQLIAYEADPYGGVEAYYAYTLPPADAIEVIDHIGSKPVFKRVKPPGTDDD